MLGDKIKLERVKRNMRQSDLAEILGVSSSTIGMYEQNRRQPDSVSLTKIARLFNVTTDYLLGVAEDSDRDHTNTQYEIPEMFDDPGKAREYVDKHRMFGSSGLDTSKLDDEEIVRFANELLEQMKMVSYKYRK